ncbi:MAG TPA: metallophosphoesterase, partial [Gemmatimonadaceae bacterium]|nr:metallophosphoesterase [Gemmatimonadaceae bacterium]
MRLVHLSDLHLGFRQYQRQTPAGINQREADVAASFKRAIDKTIELTPDFVLIAGDVFHTVRPTNSAILYAFTQFARLAQALPKAGIVMVAGNHDTPRTTETGCILRLFAPLGIHIVEGEARRVDFPEMGVSILGVPDLVSGRPALTPDPNS